MCYQNNQIDLAANKRCRTINEAKRRFQAYRDGDETAIPSSLRSAVFRTVISEGGHSEYEVVKEEYTNTTSIDGKEICLQSLGRVSTTELVNDFMDFQFSPAVAVQDAHSGSIALAANPKARNALWKYVKEHWGKVHGKLSGNPVVLDRYLKTTLQKFANHEVAKDIADFFSDKDTKGYDRGLVQVADTIRGNATYKERDGEVVLEWLKTHDYA